MAGSSALLWVAAAVVGLATVAPELDQAVSVDPAEMPGGFAIPRGPDGQFYVEGKVGEIPVRFLVDPNLEEVVISGTDAERLGVVEGQVSLPAIAVGPTVQQGVTARIAPAMPVSLLGRAYLSRLAVAQVQGDRLVLR
jgi:predicted aspartyl protease